MEPLTMATPINNRLCICWRTARPTDDLARTDFPPVQLKSFNSRLDPYAANPVLARSAMVAKAAFSWTAKSARTRLSISIFSFFNPAIKRL